MWSCIHSIPVPTDIRAPQGKPFVMLARNHVIPGEIMRKNKFESL